jgi:hypothetical protein
MLSRTFKVILIAVISTLAACGQRIQKDFDYEIAPTRYQESRREAINWITQSMQSSDWSQKDVAKLKKLKDLLENSSLNYVINQDNTPCTDSGRTAAFVLHPNNVVEIYVCQLSDQFSQSFVAQVLIHESVHLGGIFDECETTKMEMEITRESGRIPFKNGYVDSCGLN